MLRQNNSNRLSRHKSTSSVYSKHDSVDPEVARRHAHAAATLAFTRAQERGHADVGRSGVQRNSPPNQQSQQRFDRSNDDDRVIKRQQSVRFAGPNAIQGRQFAGGRTTHSQIIPQRSSATLRPVAMTTNTPVPAAYRPPSRSSSIGKGSISKATAENLKIVNGAFNEYYTREDDVASTPSSYRRIRRSKSMFSPLKAPSIFYTNGTPERPEHPQILRQNSFLTSRISQDQHSHGNLRTPKSTSFLREGKSHMTIALRERNDTAVQLARDRFFSQTAQQRLREQPSFLFRSKAQRQERLFRKSVRSSSNNSCGMPISSNENEPPKESSLKDAARKASKSLRTKLKRVFGRSKDEPVDIPNQQGHAKETHVRQYLGDLPVDQFSNIPQLAEPSVSRVSVGVPSLHASGSNQRLRSHAGSVKSVKSFATDNSDDRTSRVTSWNSTGVNTITSQTAARAQAEREQQQRLSIINENGTHVSSSNLKTPALKNQFSAYPLMQRQGNVPPIPGPVDSARVYSALMKRLDESNHQAIRQCPSNGAKENQAATVTRVPPLPGSAAKNYTTTATIRCVRAEPSESSSESHHDHQWVRADSVRAAKSDDVFGHSENQVHQWATSDWTGASSANKENIPVRQCERSDGSGRSRHNGVLSYHAVPGLNRPSPQEIALKYELLTLPGTKVLRDSRSTFFGGTSSFTISRTPSPFRRALAEAERDSQASIQQWAPIRLSPLRNPLFSSGSTLSEEPILERKMQEPDIAYSESVYSRTTSGRTPEVFGTLPRHNTQAVPSHNVNDSNNRQARNGDVVIIESTTYRPIIPARKGHTTTNPMGSSEWKKWMSSEVAKLEKAKDGPTSGSSYVNYALPTMPKSFDSGHHVREYAQINDDDTEVVQAKVPVMKQPLGIIQQNPNLPHGLGLRPMVQGRSTSSLISHASVHSNPQKVINLPRGPDLRPILKNRSTSSLIENAGVKGNSTPVARLPPSPPTPPPMPPIRSSLRLVPSKSSIRSFATVNSLGSVPKSAVKTSSVKGRGVLHKRNGSSATLRSTKSADTPAKLVKRAGPPTSKASVNPSPASKIPIPNDKQFGSISSRSGSPVRGNMDFIKASSEKEDIYNNEGAGLMGPETKIGVGEMSEREVQSIGSKRMVDLFLSSRRKRIVSASDEGGTQVFL